jgi:hypothetical protein
MIRVDSSASCSSYAFFQVRILMFIGIRSSIESLLEKGFKPTRTVVLSFGFDEEVSGIRVRFPSFIKLLRPTVNSCIQGARTLAQALNNIYGKDGIAFVIDEGGKLIFILSIEGALILGFQEDFLSNTALSSLCLVLRKRAISMLLLR